MRGVPKGICYALVPKGYPKGFDSFFKRGNPANELSHRFAYGTFQYRSSKTVIEEENPKGLASRRKIITVRNAIAPLDFFCTNCPNV